MRSLCTLICLSLLTGNAFAKWGSVTTDLKQDCIVISSATEDAPIDFYQAECKSFAGFSLFIEGGDLRYGPELNFERQKIDLMRPMHFHDMAEEKIEWFYDLDVDHEGLGKLDWRGLTYSLSVASDDGDKSIVQYFAVALRGEKSCVVSVSGEMSSAEKALRDPARPCINALK